MDAPRTYEVAFLAGDMPAPFTGTFRFAKPEGYSFTPGQYLSLTLMTKDGEQTKPFTHDEAPDDPYLEITTRLSGSAFKNALEKLAPGELVHIAGPRGRMTLPADAHKVAFLVGGVGVTPARSIIRDAVVRGTGLVIALFYGNQDQDGIPFGEEFDGYAAEHSEITVVHVLAAPKAGWKGESGFITAEVVRRHLESLDEWHWVVTGPPAMIDAMKRVLFDLDIPEERVSLESFAGYA
jgi:ferredoxin-NADP reductase